MNYFLAMKADQSAVAHEIIQKINVFGAARALRASARSGVRNFRQGLRVGRTAEFSRRRFTGLADVDAALDASRTRSISRARRTRLGALGERAGGTATAIAGRVQYARTRGRQLGQELVRARNLRRANNTFGGSSATDLTLEYNRRRGWAVTATTTPTRIWVRDPTVRYGGFWRRNPG